MRIVVNTISTKKGAGGAYQIASNFLMETLKHQSGVEWYYITSQDVDDLVGKNFEPLKGIRYFVFPTQPDFKKTYSAVKKELKAWEEQYHPDVIYTISSPCYFTFNTPEVMRFANAWVTNPNRESWSVMPFKALLRMYFYRWNQIRLLRKAKYIITQSETVKKGLLRITKLPDNHVKVVPNVLPQFFAKAQVEHVNNQNSINVICAAAPVPHKNLDIIPKVLEELYLGHGISNVRFHLTIPEGNSLLKQIQSNAHKMGLDKCIVNHGRCTQQQLIDIYNNCDICFLPTLLETFSASSLEAMYFGLCIVATDYGFNSEVIGNAGLYYKPMNAKDAANQIASLIKDDSLTDSLKSKMKERLSLYNDYDQHFTSIVSFLEEVAIRNRAK